jgi:hypothetical protein
MVDPYAITQHGDYPRLLGELRTHYIPRVDLNNKYIPKSVVNAGYISKQEVAQKYTPQRNFNAELKTASDALNQQYLTQMTALNQKIIQLSAQIRKMVEVPLTPAKQAELCQITQYIGDIRQHPQYATLVESTRKQALATGAQNAKKSTKPCVISNFLIQQHPDFKNYIEKKVAETTLSTQIEQLKTQYQAQLKVLQNRPVQKCPQQLPPKCPQQLPLKCPTCPQQLPPKCPTCPQQLPPKCPACPQQLPPKCPQLIPPKCPTCPQQQKCPTCPAVKAISDFPISTHPDFKLYIPRTQMPKCPVLPPPVKCPAVKVISDFPITSHPDFKLYTPTALIPKPIVCPKPLTIKDFNIRNHPDFNRYITKDECPKVKTISDFPITSHPDFHLYIRKQPPASTSTSTSRSSSTVKSPTSDSKVKSIKPLAIIQNRTQSPSSIIQKRKISPTHSRNKKFKHKLKLNPKSKPLATRLIPPKKRDGPIQIKK